MGQNIDLLKVGNQNNLNQAQNGQINQIKAINEIHKNSQFVEENSI